MLGVLGQALVLSTSFGYGYGYGGGFPCDGDSQGPTRGFCVPGVAAQPFLVLLPCISVTLGLSPSAHAASASWNLKSPKCCFSSNPCH